MSYDKKQFGNLISRVLLKMEMHKPEATDLLLGTAAAESWFGKVFHQVGGPAVGPYQMEPPTAADICHRYLVKSARARDAVYQIHHPGIPIQNMPIDDVMWKIETDLAFSTALARVRYWMVPAAIPRRDQYQTNRGYVTALGQYWKQNYNTPLGKGTVDHFVDMYERYIIYDH